MWPHRTSDYGGTADSNIRYLHKFNAVNKRVNVRLKHHMNHNARLALLHLVMHTVVMSTAIRKSVPLDKEDIEVLDLLQTAGSPERRALIEVAGITLDENASEASSIRALLTAGRVAIERKVISQGYEAYAASLNEEDRAAHAAMRGRTTKRTID